MAYKNLTWLNRKGYSSQVSSLVSDNEVLEGIEINDAYKYRIGLSLAEKVYMEKGYIDEQSGDHYQITLQLYNSASQKMSREIQIGKTQRYEAEIDNVKFIKFPKGFPYGLIFQITCLGLKS